MPKQTKKGCDDFETTVEKLLARRIQIFWVQFCVIHFDLFFKITLQITPEQKCTQQNQIRLVEYSCTKVSGPSEMHRFVRELIF